MTEPLRIDDALADLDSKVAALELGLVQYQHGVSSWTSQALTQVTKSVGSVELMGKELTHRETLIHNDRTEIERQHAEAVEMKKACENRQKELNELAELLAQAERDAAVKEKKLREELEQQRADLEKTELSLSGKCSQADSMQESHKKRTQEIEIEAQRQQKNRVQWERECAEQQAKLDAQTKELECQNKHLQERVDHCKKEGEQVRSLAGQLEERKNQLEHQEADLAAREADLVDRERSHSEIQAAYGVRECRLDESQQQMESDRAESKTRKEQLEKHQTQLDRQAQEQKVRDRELLAQSEQLAREAAHSEKKRIATAELEARCQALEKSLAADRLKFEKENLALESQRERLHTLETSLQTDRTELTAAREAYDAQIAASQIKLVHEQDQLQVKIGDASQRENELHNARTAMERLKEEFERRIAQAGDREAGLVAQQAKLETALTGIQNDRLAVQKARSMADEVAQARSDELAKSRQEVDALRAEIASLRHSYDDLQHVLQDARDAAQRETAAAETARRELQVAAAQAESSTVAATESALSAYQQQLEKAETAMTGIRAELEAAAGQRNQLENDLLNALEGREQTAQKLEETRVELEQVGKSLEQERAQWAAQMEANKERQNEARLAVQNTASVNGSNDVVGLTVDAESASHAGVGAFWTSMVASEQYANQVAHLEVGIQAQVGNPLTETSPPLEGSEPGVQAPAEDMASAMQAALAAAHAEVNENHASETAATKQRSRAGSKRAKATVPDSPKEPAKPAAKAPDAPAQIEKAARVNAAPSEPSIELDPETRRKLKMLMRLNPNKSERELLATIKAQIAQPAKPKAKRGWFATK